MPDRYEPTREQVLSLMTFEDCGKAEARRTLRRVNMLAELQSIQESQYSCTTDERVLRLCDLVRVLIQEK